MDDTFEKIVNTMNSVGENLSVLAKKVFFYRNENITLHKKISRLEQENRQLRSKKEHTIAKLKKIMEKFEDAGY